MHLIGIAFLICLFIWPTMAVRIAIAVVAFWALVACAIHFSEERAREKNPGRGQTQYQFQQFEGITAEDWLNAPEVEQKITPPPARTSGQP